MHCIRSLWTQHQLEFSRREDWECGGNSPANTPSSVKKQKEEVPQAPEQRFPWAPGAAHGEAAVPLQPMGVPGGAQIHMQPAENPTPEQVDALWFSEKPTLVQAPGRTCGLMERGAHGGAGFLATLVTPWKTYAGALSP